LKNPETIPPGAKRKDRLIRGEKPIEKESKRISTFTGIHMIPCSKIPKVSALSIGEAMQRLGT
jgi:hypothetical protein